MFIMLPSRANDVHTHLFWCWRQQSQNY